MPRGLWTGTEKATGKALDAGFKMLDYQADQNYRGALIRNAEARLGMEQEAAEREKIAFEASEKKRKEQEAIDNAYVPASSIVSNINSLPTWRSAITETLDSAGLKYQESGGELYVQNKAVKYLTNLHQNNLAFMEISTKSIRADLENQNAVLSQNILAAQEKGDEKTLGALKQKQAAIQGQIASLMTAEDKIKYAADQLKPTYKVFNNKLLEITPAGTKIMLEGDKYQLALSSAMKDPAWQWADEAEQAELITKHMGFQKGETKTAPKEMTDEAISRILKDGGYAATPENIATFRKNNGL